MARILAATFITTIIPNVYTFDNVYANTSYISNQENVNEDKKWNLIWEDNFEGDSLNFEDWNYEPHEPGWVNNELQEYTEDVKNVYVKDGNLVLKAIKEETEEGTTKYTSGKVTTQNKRDYKYGRFESRLKVPNGQGLWPAFWMMPTDENLYGSWPRCGEIDIMEVLGHEPNKAYGTIHYGSPHKSDQGEYTLNGETFADDYHVFAVEWEPSEMRFYIDDNLYHTSNDWYTKQEGGEEIAYPAPFDQTFFLQFNLAVGGNWPGEPDESTNFDNAEYKIDYVKVYQLENYDENVLKPEKPTVVLRDPDATGNFINDGNFSENENLDDNINWSILTALNGKGSSIIKDNKIILSSENWGTENYSLQLVQAALPLKKNDVYKLSFDAKAAEDRDMVVNITSPNRGYIRQFQDTVVDLTNDLKNYSYEFTMKDDDEANARLEFNYGKRGSLADIEITNVRLEKVKENENIDEDIKTILPDGNYVYNGTFDVGQDRMKYWKVESKIEGIEALVTNINNIREFKINVPTTVSSLSDVILKESELGIVANKEYYFSFDAYAEEDKIIKAQINDESFEAKITRKKKNFKYKFKTEDILKSKDSEFLLGAPGVTYIDNVKIVDTGLIINGDFNNEFSKWELFKDSGVSSSVSSRIDKSNGNNAAQIDISNTGDADWKIQLKQTGVKLEQGKKYKLSLDAKSTTDRQIMFTIQKDGSSDNDWKPYANTQIVDLQNEYNNYNVIFEMTENSDLNSIFSISMGAVNNIQINEAHSIYIDNINLVEVNDIELNTKDLLDYILQARGIINSDGFDDIVESDRKNLINILDKAEKIYENAISEDPLVTQEEIDAATMDLKKSISDLREEDKDNNVDNDSNNQIPEDDINNDENTNSDEKEENTNSDEKEENTNSDEKEENTNPGEKEESTNSDEKEENTNSDEKEESTNSSEKEESTNSTLVNTGQESYWAVLGILLILCGIGINFIRLNGKNKKVI